MFKLNITEIPLYNDGFLNLFEIRQSTSDFPIEKIRDLKRVIWYEEISITDRLRYEFEQRKQKLTLKLRIPQIKEITALNVVKINGKYHKVFNVYHFTNKQGYKQTDLTLEEYLNEEVLVNE